MSVANVPEAEAFVSVMTPKLQAIQDVRMLKGAELVDNLILLRFLSLAKIKDVLQSQSGIDFYWLRADPTPSNLKDIAAKHHVIIESGKWIVYVPLGVDLDTALLEIDIPSVSLTYKYIADCNYAMLKYGLSGETLTSKFANLNPLLVFRRIVADAIETGTTDIHFVSTYVDKVARQFVRYRIQNSLVDSKFKLDAALTKEILFQAISKLSTVSVSDLDSGSGITTDVTDIFDDGSTDLRITAHRVAAGFMCTIRIQSLNTTSLHVDELGMPAKDTSLIREIASHRTGLTFVTGKMRSGKNTTIFAMVNELVDLPIQIVEYSNPIETLMPYPQFDYKGDVDELVTKMALAKKMDIDVAVLNEIPNREVAFAARDLVNSAVGVFTTTHLDRVWNIPLKLQEFYGEDYKTVISQLNAVINQRMFRRWHVKDAEKRILDRDKGQFEAAAWRAGVRNYFVPRNLEDVTYTLQPLAEIVVFTDEMKHAMLEFDSPWKAEQMIRLNIQKEHGTLEDKVADYINKGYFSLEEFSYLF